MISLLSKHSTHFIAVTIARFQHIRERHEVGKQKDFMHVWRNDIVTLFAVKGTKCCLPLHYECNQNAGATMELNDLTTILGQNRVNITDGGHDREELYGLSLIALPGVPHFKI